MAGLETLTFDLSTKYQYCLEGSPREFSRGIYIVVLSEVRGCRVVS